MDYPHTYVYIAGPLHTSGRFTANIDTTLQAANEVISLGGTPFIPHLFAFWDMINTPFPSADPEAFWLDLDKTWLTKCDALLRLPGESRGSDMEERWAREFNTPIFFDVDNLGAWIRERAENTDPLPFSLDGLQAELKPWAEHNFPHEYGEGVLPYRPLLGLVEELGELAHAHLKQEQGIRGTAEEQEDKGKDAIADLFIYMADYASKRGWDLQEIVGKVWRETVSKRDWNVNTETGRIDSSKPNPPSLPQQDLIMHVKQEPTYKGIVTSKHDVMLVPGDQYLAAIGKETYQVTLIDIISEHAVRVRTHNGMHKTLKPSELMPAPSPAG